VDVKIQLKLQVLRPKRANTLLPMQPKMSRRGSVSMMFHRVDSASSEGAEASAYGSLEEEDLKKAGFGVGGLNFAPPSPRRATPTKPRPPPPSFGGGGGGGFDDAMATTWPRTSPPGGTPGGIGGAADPRFGGSGDSGDSGVGGGGRRDSLNAKLSRGGAGGLRRSLTASDLAPGRGSGMNGLGGSGGMNGLGGLGRLGGMGMGGIGPPDGRGGGRGGGRRAPPRTQSTPNICGGSGGGGGVGGGGLAQALAGIVVQSSIQH